MPEYQCRIATASGEIIERTYESQDEATLRRELAAKDYLVLDLKQNNPLVQQILSVFNLTPSVSAKEFVLFNQEFSALLKAGLPVLQSLDILLERRADSAFGRSLADIRERVKSGEALSDAFSAQGDMFPKLYPATLASGERSGELHSVLRRFIAYSQNLLSLKKKVVSAMVYPVILVVLMAGLIALMMFFILPKFREFLMDFGAELPLPTRILMGAAEFCATHWHLIVLGVVGGFVALTLWKRTTAGQAFLDRLVLKIPVIGGIVHDYAQNRFTRTMATLQAGGIPLVTSLEIAARAVGNTLFETELFHVAGRVREGQALWESLEETGLISSIAIEMIKVGESTGALVEMLEDVSDFVDQEIDHKLQRLVALIEPLMLITMAFVVGGMLLAIYYPMIQVYGQSQF